MLIITVFIIIIILLLIKKKDSLNILINKNNNLNKLNDDISDLIIKKRDLLYDICKEINNLNNKEMFTKLHKIKKEDDNFNLDRLLNGIYKDLKEYLMINKTIVFDDKIKEKIKDLYNLEIEIEAEKTYYNKEAEEYNKLFEPISNKNKAKNNKLDYHFNRILEKEELFEIYSIFIFFF